VPSDGKSAALPGALLTGQRNRHCCIPIPAGVDRAHQAAPGGLSMTLQEERIATLKLTPQGVPVCRHVEGAIMS